VDHDQGRALDVFDHLGYGKGLACARSTEKSLVPVPLEQTLDEQVYGLGLISRRLKFRYDLKLAHVVPAV
jgi:hypothetical protein